MSIRRHNSLVFVCGVPLDQRNGAGIYALIPYLRELADIKITSLFFLGTAPQQGQTAGLHVDYVGVPRPIRRFAKPFLLLIAAREWLKRFERGTPCLVLPDGPDDLLLGFACSLLTRNLVLWMTDDFVPIVQRDLPRPAAWLFNQLARTLYRRARLRMVISDEMNRAYQERWGIAAELVLGKTHSREGLPSVSERRLHRPPRLVYIGSYISYYLEALTALANTDLAFELHLYGRQQPPDELLRKSGVTYHGPIASEDVVDTLSHYDFGVLPYSFDQHTRAFMRYSAPSKLVDFMAAALPVITISPRDLAIVEALTKRNIGPIIHSVDVVAISAALAKAFSATDAECRGWRERSRAWFLERHVYENQLAAFTSYMNTVVSRHKSKSCN